MCTSWRMMGGALVWLTVAAPLYAHEDMPLYHAFRLDLGAGENRDNQSVADWDLDGWWGGDTTKLWLKSEGEVVDQSLEHAEYWLLASHQIDTFWDAQLGLRHDSQPERTGYLVAGFTGLAPFHVETELHLFASEEGDTSARVHLEKDVLFTQRSILQPYLELNAYARDVQEQGVGSGLSDATFGLQWRYEVTRRFAPYVDVGYSRRFGETADYASADGEDRNDSRITAGIRLLF